MNPKLRPYVSLDLETTGVDIEKVEVLQIGAVLDDGFSPVNELETMNVLVENPIISYAENYATGLNSWIFQELMKKHEDRTYKTEKPGNAIVDLSGFLVKGASLAYKHDETYSSWSRRKVQIAGKNPGSIDVPILKNWAKRNNASQWLNDGLIDYRFIDVGNLYFALFGRNPGLNEINKVTGRSEVSHDALDDAMDVIYAVRNVVGVPVAGIK